MLLLYHSLFGVSQTQVQIPALPLTGCVMLDQLLYLSGLHVPHLNMGVLTFSSQFAMKVKSDNGGKGFIIAPGTDTLLIKCDFNY